MSKILLLGALTNKHDPSKTGGVVVLFELLMKELEVRNINFEVIDTLVENYQNSLVALLSVILQLIKKIHKCEHVSLQATTNSFIFIGPIMVIIAKLFSKTTSMRKFAGDFDKVYEKSGFIKKYLIRFVLKNTNVNFFETKYLVDYFTKFNSHTYWMPNVRERTLTMSAPRTFHKRFIFIGTINPEKGIDEICSIAERLDSDFVLDIYGPILDTKYNNTYFQEHGVNYKGALVASDVIHTLNRYDVMILPSYREGYPGVIIEAFSLGIPVIATKLEGIMEMVQNQSNGILIDVKNSEQLLDAMESINDEKYKTLHENAMKSFDMFDSSKQTSLFLERIGCEL